MKRSRRKHLLLQLLVITINQQKFVTKVKTAQDYQSINHGLFCAIVSANVNARTDTHIK